MVAISVARKVLLAGHLHSDAHQSHRARSHRAADLLSGVRRSRKRSRTSTTISPSGPISHGSRPPSSLPSSPIAYTSQRARDVRRHADGRRARADHRRARTAPHALHPAGARTPPPARQAKARTAGPAAAELPARRPGLDPRRSEDLSGRLPTNQSLRVFATSHRRSWISGGRRHSRPGSSAAPRPG